MTPIIPSILDTDHYKVTMGQVVFTQFPGARVRYRFINRGKTSFPAGFAPALEQQIRLMADLQMTSQELEWYSSAVRYLKPTYLAWLKTYQYDPAEVTVRQEGSDLEIGIEGPWYRTIFWEVPLMSLVSELYFRMQGIQPDPDWEERLHRKAERMASAGLYWSDFGSRRRFSLEVQDRVNEHMRQYAGQYLGSSNPYFSMKYGSAPIGTYAHEGPMAMQSRYGVRLCNRMWMDAWVREYQGDLGIALTDTVTTPVFLRDFDMYYAKLFDGVRIDSGDPFQVGETILSHYEKHNIPTMHKRIIFSDSLNDEKAIALHRQYGNRCMVTAGIGTFLSNDCGTKPLNMVIKLMAADFGSGFTDLVKLSDDPGKHTGLGEAVHLCHLELGLTER